MRRAQNLHFKADLRIIVSVAFAIMLVPADVVCHVSATPPRCTMTLNEPHTFPTFALLLHRSVVCSTPTTPYITPNPPQ